MLKKVNVIHLREEDLSPFQGDYGAAWVNAQFFGRHGLKKNAFVTFHHIRDGKRHSITRILRPRSVKGLNADSVGFWADDLHELRFDNRKHTTVEIDPEPYLRGLWMYLKNHPSPIIRMQAKVNLFFAGLSLLLGLAGLF